jgi:hypothetical protein
MCASVFQDFGLQGCPWQHLVEYARSVSAGFKGQRCLLGVQDG